MDINKPIIVEQTFNCNVKTVWDAITNIHKMRNWFFNTIEDFKPEVGFKTKFNVTTENRSFMHLWHIVEVEPFKKIVYNWKYEEYVGDSFVHFEIFELNNQTLLKVSAIATEPFPKNIPEFTADSCRNGWNYFIKNSLKEYLEQNQ